MAKSSDKIRPDRPDQKQGRAHYYRMRTPERRLKTHATAAAIFAGLAVAAILAAIAYVAWFRAPAPGVDDAPQRPIARTPPPAAAEETASGETSDEGTRRRNTGTSTAQELGTLQDCPTCPEIVVVGAGRFVMGLRREDFEREKVPTMYAPSELPLHGVTIPTSFGMGKLEVTRGQFAAFVEDTGYDPAGCTVLDEETGQWRQRNDSNWRNPGFKQTDEDPVVCVSWDDASQYVQWLRALTGNPYRLPSETEWEYAARAGTNTSRYWGIESRDACTYGNVPGGELVLAQSWRNKIATFECNDGFVFTAPAGSFEANAFLLYDTLGNVSEWVEDCWNGSYKGAPVDGAARTEGDCSQRVVRGGAWGDPAVSVRAERRMHQNLDLRRADIGFRVARDVRVDTGQ